MSCCLDPDPTGLYDARTSVSARAKVFVESDASPTACAVSATMNGQPVEVTASGRMTLSGLQPSTNVLAIIVVGTQANNDIHLVEACPDGTTRRVKQKFIGAAPGGPNPLVSFRIHAS